MKLVLKILTVLALIGEAVEFVNGDWAAFGVGGFILVLLAYWGFDFFKEKTAETLDRSELRHRLSLRYRLRVTETIPSDLALERLVTLIVLYVQHRYPRTAGFRVAKPRFHSQQTIRARGTVFSCTNITFEESSANESGRQVILTVERQTLYHSFYKGFFVLSVIVAVLAAPLTVSEKYKDELAAGLMIYGILAGTSLLVCYAIAYLSARRWFPRDRHQLLRDDLAQIVVRAAGVLSQGTSGERRAASTDMTARDYAIDYVLSLASQHRERLLSKWSIAVRWVPGVLAIALVLSCYSYYRVLESRTLADVKRAIDRKDDSTAEHILTWLIWRGDQQAQEFLGEWLARRCRQSDCDLPRIHELLEPLAMAGNSTAALDLATAAYMFGSYTRAREWYELWHQIPQHADNSLADYRLGRLYLRVPDIDHALSLLHSAAQAGIIEATSLLGWLNETGEANQHPEKKAGGPLYFHPDLTKALAFYTAAAEAGDLAAQRNLGFIYKKRGQTESAVFWLTICSRSGNQIPDWVPEEDRDQPFQEGCSTHADELQRGLTQMQRDELRKRIDGWQSRPPRLEAFPRS